MEYSKPKNASEENAGYIDADPKTGKKGSTIPGAAIEAPQREIVNVITGSGKIPDKDQLNQLYEAICEIFRRDLKTSIGKALSVDDESKLQLNLHDSMCLWGSQLGVAFLVSLSLAEDMTDNVIRPKITRTILRKNVNETTTFSFDSSELADLPPNVHSTVELHINMQTISAINFNPPVEWDGGEAPDMSEIKDYWLVLRTEDKGLSWKASLGSVFNGH